MFALEESVAKQSYATPKHGRELSPRKQLHQGKSAGYTDVQVLGKGRVATVMKVIDKQQKPFARKSVLKVDRDKSTPVDAWRLMSARMEVEMFRHLQSVGGHGRIISLIDSWEDQQGVHAVFPICCMDLSEFCKKGHITPQSIWASSIALFEAFEFIHCTGTLNQIMSSAERWSRQMK